MCAFCGETADGGPVDPCALIVVSHWRAPQERQREQQFFTHADCLRERLHPDVRAVADVTEP
jgi:3-phosphoglycerate kinase